MTNLALLKKKIEESGVTITFLAKKCKMSRETFYNKMAGKSEFKGSEMYYIAKALRLTKEEFNAIFFDYKGECDSPVEE